MNAAQEQTMEPTGPGFTDAVTFSWADPESGVHGLARLGLSPGGLASALCLLFVDGEPAAALAAGGIEVGDDADWSDLQAGALRATIEEPLARWKLACRFESGDELDLVFEAAGPPAELSAGRAQGYEQLCAVSGRIAREGAGRLVDGRGQRGHAWGDSQWEETELTRNVAAWLDDGTGLALTAVRPAGAESHAQETVACALLGPEGAQPVDDPRLSTTYDGDGRHLRAGLELWVGDEDGYPHRGAGRAICGSTLDLGALQLDCAFFEWRIDGRQGVGRYDVVRRA